MFNFQVVPGANCTMAWRQDGDIECSIMMGSMAKDDGSLVVIHGHVRIGSDVTAVTSTYRTDNGAKGNGTKVLARTFTV